MDDDFYSEFEIVPPGKYTKLTIKNSRGRSFLCSQLPKISKSYPIKEKLCQWCNESVIRHPMRDYCSFECRISCHIWLYPGRRESLRYLMVKQKNTCAICWHVWDDNYGRIEQYDDRHPEVDHIIAIVNGGDPLGVDNMQVICRLCHKIKTKRDISKENKNDVL